jgi:hypothetical protein
MRLRRALSSLESERFLSYLSRGPKPPPLYIAQIYTDKQKHVVVL